MKNKQCPVCHSYNHDSKSDHLFLLKDGETWACFRSEYHPDHKPYIERHGEKAKLPTKGEGRETIDEVLSFPLFNSEYRGIRGDTFKYFEVRCSFKEEDGSVQYLYFPILAKGNLVGFHRRSLESKTFINIGSIAGKELDLFGFDKCSKSGKNIVICEGHLDALSVYQVIKDRYSKINPNIVSLNNGTGSLREIGNHRNDLTAYEHILLSFDMDTPGQEAVAKVSKLLGGKVRVIELSEKDANDCLTKGKGHEIINGLFNPKEYIPSDIVTLADIYDEILKESPEGIPFPFEGLNELTYGIFDRQIISIGAGPGAGKTVFMNQLTAYLVKEFKKKIGLFSLEETPAYTAKKLIGSLIQKRIHLPKVVVTREEIEEEFQALNKYIYIYDTQGVLSWDDIKANIRYLTSLGVNIFIVDPLTAVTAQHSASEANELLNSMCAELAGIVQHLGITVFLISHLNSPKTGRAHSEGGTISGEQFTQSRALFRWSHLVLGLERNLQAEEEEEKNRMIVRVIKNRAVGKTGTVPLVYNTETGLLVEEQYENIFS